MHLMVAVDKLPMALVGSDGGCEGWLRILLGGEGSLLRGLDGPSPAYLALLDRDLNSFMIKAVKTSNHT